ncbi:type II CAAX prenyl endopeptidase Rce1 family protein [Brevundimonas sp.]|uniref:CPBP family glutamic-type intramembrane protease n=1 Tax=Brevundimonas sp. TaxID=1871086 RepID=UPI002EDB7212
MAGARRGLPFADDSAAKPAAWRWAVALLSAVAGFAALLLVEPALGMLAAALLFVGIPLAGLFVLTEGRLGLILPPPSGRDVAVGLGFGLLNLIAIPLLGWLITRLLPTAPNPVGDLLSGLTPGAIPGFFATTGIQLVGEELVTVIPFLAVMVLMRGIGFPRGAAVAIGALGAALAFAAMHLPTYQWHVLQTVVLIGGARLILLGAYLVTRNLWASVIAHIFNDWMLFGSLILLARAAT